MQLTPAIFNWSGGKDSAFALHKILKNNSYQVQYLVTSVSEELQRISMHGVRTGLLHKQCLSIGIPLREIKLPEAAKIDVYNKVVGECMQYSVNKGINTSIFGDIFLEDLREYREKQLNIIGMKALFPLWKMDTKMLAQEFIQQGFKAIVTCIDAQKLNESFVGRHYNESFLSDLPANIDPCGENGEFHTFVFDGPIFKNSIDFSTGDKVYRTYSNHEKEQTSENGFWFIDLTAL